MQTTWVLLRFAKSIEGVRGIQWHGVTTAEKWEEVKRLLRERCVDGPVSAWSSARDVVYENIESYIDDFVVAEISPVVAAALYKWFRHEYVSGGVGRGAGCRCWVGVGEFHRVAYDAGRSTLDWRDLIAFTVDTTPCPPNAELTELNRLLVRFGV